MVKTMKRYKLVNCTTEYWEFVRILRNNPLVQDGFIEHIEISEEQQISYMNKYSNCYRIATLDDVPIGYVGVIDNDIRICTHPDYQKLGVGKFMLTEIIKQFPTAYGKVKITNEASKQLFKSIGFTETFIIYTKN